MEQRMPLPLLSVLCLGIAFLYVPILVLIGYSFNASALSSVWGGFSTRWYASLLENDQFLAAASMSLRVAFVSAALATIVGACAALATWIPGTTPWAFALARMRARAWLNSGKSLSNAGATP